MMDRRAFVQTAAGAAAISSLKLPLPQADGSIRDLCMRALNTAKAAGASYADIRVARTRNQSVSTREQQITVAERLHAARGFAPWPACSAKLGLS